MRFELALTLKAGCEGKELSLDTRAPGGAGKGTLPGAIFFVIIGTLRAARWIFDF